ncbi:LysR family transcriptional regulator [Streptomyces sp. NBC_01615]|uniref:LysR family transcriptional regulator n=1 Tax=Streptomyces sp. NBC_01615 TaxID=2975898 RepID=UPI00386BFCA0
MELRQMRYFVAVAQELHFGRAAARLHISTPTLSQQIKAVEREIGAPLLIRHSRGVDLTPAGRVLLRAAQDVLRSAEEALRATRRTAGVAAPVLRLGLLNGVPPWLPARIEDVLAARVPGCRTVMTGGTTAAQVRLLDSGEVDLALLRSPVTLPAGLRQTPVAEEELGVLMSAGHPLTDRDTLDLADLAGQELILFPRESAPGLHDRVLETLRSGGAGIALSDSAMGHAQLRSALPLLPAAIGLSSARGAALPDLAWRPLRGRPLVVGYAAAWHSESRDPAVHAVLAALSGGRVEPS